MLQTSAPQFGRAINSLADGSRLPALIHCTAGKDRTGLVIALVLSAVGVEREEILRDYELSTEGRAWRCDVVAPALEAAGIDPDAVYGLYSAPRESLQMALDHLDHTHGSVTGYLRRTAGVDAAAIDRLRSSLVVDRSIDHLTSSPG